ncbi:MAG: hypothetical protein LAP39_23065 [Acidobacteriia bacterium]|nr:hypothetical protein [Terriglobia bacterium]
MSICLLAWPANLTAADLKPQTVKAFDEYIRGKEAHLRNRISGGKFLWADQAPGRKEQLREGKILTDPSGDQPDLKVPDGVIHDWLGAVFIPGVTVDRAINFVQDYEHHPQVYQPEVIGSRILAHNGDDYKVFLRLKKKKVLTVVLNTEHAVHYERLDNTRWQSRSCTTHIAEVENAGKADERELPPGKDHGFLWRLNSYWRFQERDGGVYIECEAVSLTRRVPTGLGWLIDPIIRELPRESLFNTLQSTRTFLLPK